jgi:hypothetical protein
MAPCRTTVHGQYKVFYQKVISFRKVAKAKSCMRMGNFPILHAMYLFMYGSIKKFPIYFSCSCNKNILVAADRTSHAPRKLCYDARVLYMTL